MPPKAAARQQLSQEEFLAVCIKCLKEKPVIDYTRVAEITGLSAGGAANKFRQVMKEVETNYDVETKPAGTVDAPVAKAKATTKKRKAKAEKEDADDDAAEASEDQKPTVKKGKATEKAAPKATKKDVKKEVAQVESEEETGDAGTGDAGTGDTGTGEGAFPTPEK